MEDIIEKIADLIKKSGKFTLTKSEPEESNHEIVLQLLDGLGLEAESKLPVALQKKVWAYRYQKYRLFLELHVMPCAVEVTKLPGLDKNQVAVNELGKHTRVAEKRTQHSKESEQKAEEKANIVFVPELWQFDQNTQEQIRWFQEHKGYENFAKFLNTDKPAISLSFHTKHKYVLRKDIDKGEVKMHLAGKIDMLKDEVEKAKEMFSDLGMETTETTDNEREIAKLERILANVNNLTFSASSYEKYYRYLTMNYRYKSGKGQEQISRKRKANFVHVDDSLINTKVPRADKEVHKYIESCECFLVTPRMNFYYEKTGSF